MQKRLKRRRIETEVQATTFAEASTSPQPIPSTSAPHCTRQHSVSGSASTLRAAPEAASRRSVQSRVTARRLRAQEASSRSEQPAPEAFVTASQHRGRGVGGCVSHAETQFRPHSSPAGDTSSTRPGVCSSSPETAFPTASTASVESGGGSHHFEANTNQQSPPLQAACNPPSTEPSALDPDHQTLPANRQASTADPAPSQTANTPPAGPAQQPAARASAFRIPRIPTPPRAGVSPSFSHSWTSPVQSSTSAPGAVHFHLPLGPERISQLSSATPEDMRAITNFFTQLVQRVMPAMAEPQPWQHDARTPDFKVRWERAANYFTSLPLQTYYDRPALEKMSVRELKDIVAERGVPTAGLLEKADLVSRLLEGGDTSSGGDTCLICSEAYVAGEDVIRVLPCKHVFHVECIDHWFRNPVDYSRRPCCPMCKAELPLPD